MLTLTPNDAYATALTFMRDENLTPRATHFSFDEFTTAVTILVNGDSRDPDKISPSLLWKTGSHGITSADILVDNLDIRVQIYDEGTNA